MLNYLVELDKIYDCSPDLSTEVQSLTHELKAVAGKLIPCGTVARDLSYFKANAMSKDQAQQVSTDDFEKSLYRVSRRYHCPYSMGF